MSSSTDSASPSPVRTSNRLNLDYAREAQTFAPRPRPIIDVHSHILGREAARVYQDAARLYGIGLTYTMTPFEVIDGPREVLGDSLRFIAVPNWRAEDRRTEFTENFLRRIEDFHAIGSRMVKFWVAPRSRDMAREAGMEEELLLNSPYRKRAMELATSLNMCFMAHVADPDTWFGTKYADAERYGTKREQYEPFEEVLAEFPQPWIGAHMGGWPEDLEFLSGLLDRHDNLYLDTSACKWMVRELSRHSRADLLMFLQRYRGRILYGSDIVTADEHLVRTDDQDQPQYAKAHSPEDAFDLYASRYWAYRVLFETDYEGESPISDPDLHLVDPDRHAPEDAPRLAGKSLPGDLLDVLYTDAAHALLGPYHGDDPDVIPAAAADAAAP